MISNIRILIKNLRLIVFVIVAMNATKTINGQLMPAKYWVLSNPNTTGSYVARDYISMTQGFSCNSMQGLFSALLDEKMIIEKDDYEEPIIEENISINKNLPVGVIEGTASVGNDGSANYNIPIVLPSGTAGLQPNLSISYNSNSGNGLLGLGWNINGLSAITRVSKTVFRDGEYTGIQLNDNDRLALDGNNLVLVNSGHNYWDYGIEKFTTYNENYTRISYINNNSFIVLTPTGAKIEYGNTPESKVKPIIETGAVFAWCITKITDKFGNYIKINYRMHNDEQNIVDNIEYTGNDIVNLKPYNKICFYYEIKKDKNFAFLAGGKINNILLINKIKVLNNDKVIGEYQFSYSFDNNLNVTKLKEVKYIINNKKQLNSTKVIWNYNSSYFCYTSPPMNFTDPIRTGVGDFNGDGKDEYFVLKGHYDNSSPAKFVSDNWWLYAVNNQNYTLLNSGSMSGLEWPDLSHLQSLDFNGDGKDEIVLNTAVRIPNRNDEYQHTSYIYKFDNSNNLILLTFFPFSSNGTYSNPAPSVENKFIDFNGDGNGDYMILINGASANKWKLWCSNPDYSYTAVDLPPWSWGNVDDPTTIKLIKHNGNNKTDLLVTYNKNPNITHSIIYELGQSYQWNKLYESDIDMVNGIKFGDFNGDGNTDFLKSFGEGISCIYYSTGKYYGSPSNITNFTASPDFTGYTPYPDDVSYVKDIDGDNIDDIIQYIGNSHIYIYLMKPDGIKKRFNFNVPNLYYSSHGFQFGDFNGDGIIEIVGHSDESIPINPYIIWFSNKDYSNYVNKIYDGFKNRVDFDMLLLTAGNPFYNTFSSPNPPDVINFPPKNYSTVHKIYEIDKKDRILTENEYLYRGLKYHKTDNKMLGFLRIERADRVNGNTLITDFNYPDLQFTNISLLPVETVYLDDYDDSGREKNVTVTDYTYVVKDLNGSGKMDGNSRILMWVSQTKVTDEINHVIKVTEYDPYAANNNSDTYFNGMRKDLYTTKVYNNSIGTTPVYTEIQSIGYALNSPLCSWYSHLPSVVKTDREITGQPKNTRYIKYNYANNNHNVYCPFSIITDINMPVENQVTSTFSDYDYFGNCGKKVISGSDFSSRIYKAVFDETGRFLKKSINPLDFFETYNYNSLGQLLSSTDINNHTIYYQYDELLRPKKTIFPDGNFVVQTTEWDENDISYLYKTSTTTSNSTPAIVYYDCVGRMCRKENIDLFNRSIITDIAFNDQGQVVNTSLPYFKNGGTQYNTVYTYDGMGRRKVTQYPLGPTETITYNEKEIIVLLSKAGVTKTKTQKINALGWPVEITDNMNNKIFYEYNSIGLPVKTWVNSLPQTKIDYYYNGLKWKLKDPDAGTTEYVYNSDGTIKQVTNSSNINTYYSYDILGRLIKEKIGSSIETNYIYDTRTNGKGMIATVSTIGSDTEEYYYDYLSRLCKTSKIFEGINYDYLFTYNSKGQIESKQYPGGFGIKYIYQDEYLKEIQDLSDGTPIWSINDLDNFGAVTDFKYGNGINTSLSFTPTEHLLTEINTGNHTKQWWQYQYDVFGNMTDRSNPLNNKAETFTFDNLDKLLYINGPAQQNVIYCQDGSGRIQYNTNIGTYNYTDPNHFNAVSKITNFIGNIPPDQIITYTPFNNVASISQENKRLDFVYGSNKQRLKTEYKENGSSLITKYFLGDYEKVINNSTNTVKEINYVNSPSGLVAVNIKEGSPATTYFVCNDHQGSITALMNKSGNVVEQYSYNAWGIRRNPSTWWVYENIPEPTKFDRGYTGHEHLDKFGLINMNGRLYDPMLGRMLSPDNNVQAPGNSQSYDRYAYCLNNPLKYNDPSGEYWGLIARGFTIAACIYFNYQSGDPNAVRTGYNEGNALFNEMMGKFNYSTEINENSSYGVQFDPFSFGVNAYYTNGDWTVPIGASAGLSGSSGFNGGLVYSQTDGDFSIGGSYGMGSNYKAWQLNFQGKDWGFSYGQTYYGNAISKYDKQAHKQPTGTFGLYGKVNGHNVGMQWENDFFALSGDKWRTNAMELQIDNFVVGSSIYTNDGKAESGIENPTYNGESANWGYNRSKKFDAWKNGKVFSSPFWIGYKTGSKVTRIGFGDPIFQDILQDGIHQNPILKFINQNYYLDYENFDYSPYFYSGYYSPYTLF